MTKLVSSILVFLLGGLLTFFTLKYFQKDYRQEDIQIIKNGIENVSKLIVTEEYFTQYYTYKDADSYLLDFVKFQKKAAFVVNAKVLVFYDLKKMSIEIDSLHHTIIIHKIPEPEINIIPTIKYFDFEQSIFNTFDSNDMNAMQRSSFEKFKSNLKLTTTKELAHQRLVEELHQLWKIAKILNWKIEDRTQQFTIFSSQNTIKN